MSDEVAAAGSPADPAVRVHVQVAATAEGAPSGSFIESCVRAAVAGHCDEAEVTLRVVDRAESQALNLRWRGLDRPTNVLSFPMSGVPDVAPALLGDIAICAPLVQEEAAAQGKTQDAHWAHLVVHGVLHLLGFDHDVAAEADTMESHERRALARLGYSDPYA